LLLRLAALSAAALLLPLTGSCGGQPESGWYTLVKETVTIAEGESVSYWLEPARYRLSVTSNPNGVTVTAPASGCIVSTATRNWGGDCTLTEAVNIFSVSNPVDVDRGAPESVSIAVYAFR
jgi:hypothetical protein